jgi:hypothetical protein
MSYTFNLFDGTKLNLGDLQIRGIKGSQIMIEVKKYLSWLELPAIQRSSDPKIQEFIGLQLNKGTLDERLKQVLPVDLKNKLESEAAALDDRIQDFITKNSTLIANTYSDEEFDIERGYKIFLNLLKNLDSTIDKKYLDSEHYSFDEILEFLKTVAEVKNNSMKSFLTASSI